MASRGDLEQLELLCPWEDDDFRAGLASLGESAADASRRWAADAQVLSALVARVPRCPADDRGATPWTSFRREVAVARRITDRAAASMIRQARMLVETMPVTLGLLRAGAFTVERAAAFLRELEPCSVELTRQVDADLAARVAGLPVWRITQETRRAVLALDPEAAARRVAVANDSRGIELTPARDDQACLSIYGPAVPLTRWHAALDTQARALKQAGDPRGLDALRFDLAMASLPCGTHSPADSSRETYAGPGTAANASAGGDLASAVSFGLRPGFLEAASTDCRRLRPVQAQIVVPVETALGLSNEPAWLDGYGYLSAPTTRVLLVDAELRKACVQTSTGQLVDLAQQVHRPPPTAEGVQAGLLDMVLTDATLTAIPDRAEPEHDPSEALRRFTVVRDRTCDGPSESRTDARHAHLDHDTPHPQGPTAAWNLAARATRTHQLKHYGWIPLRTPTMTVWTSPAGQLVQVLNHTAPPPGIDVDPKQQQAFLPAPHELHLLDRAQLEPPDEDEIPWLPEAERDRTQWTCLSDRYDEDRRDDLAC